MRTIRGPIFTLRPYERGIQETLGKYTRFVMPGFGFQVPIVHIIRVRDCREHTMDIHPQPVITRDNVEITVDGVMWVRPTADEEGIKRTFYNIDDWKRAVIQLAMTNLRQELGQLSLDENLVAREKIANNLQRILNAFAVEWGLTVSKVEIHLIDPPEDIKKAMHKQKTAEFEAVQQQKLAINQGAQALKQLEMIENSWRDTSKVVITEHGIGPTLLLGSTPITAQTIADHSITLVRDDNGRLPLRLAPDAELTVITVKPVDLTPAEISACVTVRLAEAVQRRHTRARKLEMAHHAPESDIRTILHAAENASAVIVGTISADRDPSQAELVRALWGRGQHPIVVALSTPYDLMAFPMVQTYLCAYGIHPVTTEAIARVLFGEREAQGMYRAPLPGIAPSSGNLH